MIKPEYSFKQTQFQMDTLCDAHLGQSRDLFSLFENIPAFGEHLYYADVITAIVSFSDSKKFFSRNFERFNNRWSFLIHESCIALKSCSVEKNGSSDISFQNYQTAFTSTLSILRK